MRGSRGFLQILGSFILERGCFQKFISWFSRFAGTADDPIKGLESPSDLQLTAQTLISPEPKGIGGQSGSVQGASSMPEIQTFFSASKLP